MFLLYALLFMIAFAVDPNIVTKNTANILTNIESGTNKTNIIVLG